MNRKLKERLDRYRERVADRGLVQTTVWVPRDRLNDLKSIAAEMRGEAGERADV
jgi:hypothetical protein